MAKKKRAKHWSEADAGGVLDRADRSGLSDAAFGERHQINPKRLSWWRKRLGRRKRGAKNSKFIEVRARPSERLEVELRNGRRVLVPATLDARIAAEFLDAFEGTVDC